MTSHHLPAKRRRHPAQHARNVIVAFLAIAALNTPTAHADSEERLLAPTGHLCVGVYAGSPTSMVTDTRGENHGVSYDLGREFARRLNVPVEYVTFPRVADVVGAIKNGEVDFTVNNATPGRANDISFSQPMLSVELGYLVPAKSPISGSDQLDRPGIRIGVTRDSTSERTLPARFKNATIVPAENVKVAVDMFNRREIDAYATNKPTLFEISDQMPGARILDGNWGLEHMAVAMPKGRQAALPFVDAFVKEIQSNGLLETIEQKAGLRGAVKPAPN
jgi:polar amino acid transport system substrate-binding protein